MRVQVEAVDTVGYESEDYVCLSVWDGTRKIVELSIHGGSGYRVHVASARDDVKLVKESVDSW